MKNLAIASLIGMTSVMIGAFGEHFLDITNPKIGKSFHTGLRYHQIYSVVLLALSLSYLNCKDNYKSLIESSFNYFLLGITLFTGSIYLNVFFDLNFMIYVTPFGGITLILSWLYLVVRAYRFKE